MKSLHTWGGWFRSKASGNILDAALKWRPGKPDFTLYVCLRVCVCVCVCVCVSWRWPPIWLNKGKTRTSTLDMQVDSKHALQRWELKTYSKFMHGYLCVLTSCGCVCVCETSQTKDMHHEHVLVSVCWRLLWHPATVKPLRPSSLRPVGNERGCCFVYYWIICQFFHD